MPLQLELLQLSYSFTFLLSVPCTGSVLPECRILGCPTQGYASSLLEPGRQSGTLILLVPDNLSLFIQTKGI